MGWVATPFEI